MISLDGAVEILSGNELNVYIDCNDAKDNQEFIAYIYDTEHSSLYLESPFFSIICWDCFIKSTIVRSINSATGERSPYFTINHSMVRIGTHIWIDYPKENFGMHIPYNEFLLERGAIDLKNLGAWNTVGNNGKYELTIEYEGIIISIKRHHSHVIQPQIGVEEDIPQFYCSFKENTKYKLPELIFLLASLRDFLSFVTGRYIQMKDVTDYYQLDKSNYKLILHVDFSAYYPSIEEEKNWGNNNIKTPDELNGIGISTLFNRWHAEYVKNSYPLSFLNNTDKTKLTPLQYISQVIIAFDSISDKRSNDVESENIKTLRNEIYSVYQSKFASLGINKNDIFFRYTKGPSLKSRIMTAMSESNMHFKYDNQEFKDEEVAQILKNIRVSSAHGKETEPTQNIRPYHYYALSQFSEKLFIEYIRREVLKLPLNN